MQTFLPYADFNQSAYSLDNKRLGKQRVETMQIMQTLAGINSGWKNHPAVKMWKNYHYSLLQYQIAICLRWKKLGFKDTCLKKTIDIFDNYFDDFSYQDPFWLGTEKFHNSHKSNLLRKNFEFYSILFRNIPANLDYIWPVI